VALVTVVKKPTFLGEKTPTRVLSSLSATPISAKTVSLPHKHHVYLLKKTHKMYELKTICQRVNSL